MTGFIVEWRQVNLTLTLERLHNADAPMTFAGGTHMIKHLRIRNFKGWKDTGLIKMAPLTVFFGANSSGKSSIGHLLLLLKQTVDNPDRKTIVFPGNNTSPVQLGSLMDVIYHHDDKNKIEFEYIWDLANPLHIKDAKSTKEYYGSTAMFSASIGLRDRLTSEVEYLRYDLVSDDGEKLSVSMKKIQGKSSYSIKAENYELVRNTGRVWEIGAPVRFYGFPETVVAYYQNADFVQSLNLQQEKLFGSIYYLGPLRIKPQRLYTWSGSEPDSVGFSGENTIYSILAAQNRMLNMGVNKRKKIFSEIIAEKLLEMDLIDDFTLSPIAEDRQAYEVKVRAKGSIDMVDLPDVGFGISQVLPVLVQLFYAPSNSIIIMEQPEIHLHPKAQALLADVMIDAIKARENGKDRKIQLIVETHSEHFLRRLQRRIAEDVISSDQVAPYFANTAVNPTSLDVLQIDMFGNITNWPKDFFGDEMGDIAAQSIAAVKKRAKENGQWSGA